MPLQGDRKREYQREWRRARLARMHEYLGGRCIVCGSTEDLQFHHKDPAKKSVAIQALWSRKWETAVAELDKCQLRCRRCHRAEHAPKHGGGGLYKRGCRCHVCVAAYRIQKRNYLRKKRAIDPQYGRGTEAHRGCGSEPSPASPS